MRYWLSGKRLGLLAYLIIVALVIGGLAWVTVAALQLENDQFQARQDEWQARQDEWQARQDEWQARQDHLRAQADAERSHKLRLAMWRLDSGIFAELTREANRPLNRYAPCDVVRPSGKTFSFQLIELVPVNRAEEPGWAARNYLLGSTTDWRSSPVLCETLVRQAITARSKPNEAPAGGSGKGIPSTLANDDNLRKVTSAVQPQDPRAPVADSKGTQPAANPVDAQQAANPPSQLENRTLGNAQFPGNQPQQNLDRDTALRVGRAQQEKTPVYGQGYLQNGLNESDSNRNKSDKDMVAIPGPMVPLWLDEGAEERLVIARLVQIGQKPTFQVTVIDWPALQKLLTELVHDLFPGARFRRHQGDEFNPELAMTQLPIELDPGPAEPIAADPLPQLSPRLNPQLNRQPLRIGLGLAWTAALVALAAVGLGGWSLLDLSERRIRFVSAVTHELRTPMTTLRLYLDMLTGGLVRDEKQKEEYLHTLNAETDRLNRLIGNVLDFSRLENQRPRLNKTHIALPNLLEQVRNTWQSRCQDAEKELVVENSLDAGMELHVDVELVQQILGNLIDNACKYSREAEDKHIWLRARGEQDHIVLEVEDRGPGVPIRERRSIFRPFRRGRTADVTAGGVGLGLALAQRWAALLGGRLVLCSDSRDGGACFRLELPIE